MVSFYGEESFAPHPIPSWRTTPCRLFNIFTTAFHIGGHSFFCNLCMCHVVVTGTHLWQWLTPYVNEIVGYHQRGFHCNRLTTDIVTSLLQRATYLPCVSIYSLPLLWCYMMNHQLFHKCWFRSFIHSKWNWEGTMYFHSWASTS